MISVPLNLHKILKVNLFIWLVFCTSAISSENLKCRNERRWIEWRYSVAEHSYCILFLYNNINKSLNFTLI